MNDKHLLNEKKQKLILEQLFIDRNRKHNKLTNDLIAIYQYYSNLKVRTSSRNEANVKEYSKNFKGMKIMSMERATESLSARMKKIIPQRSTLKKRY